jgi:hypothetical protein
VAKAGKSAALRVGFPLSVATGMELVAVGFKLPNMERIMESAICAGDVAMLSEAGCGAL